MQRALRAVSRRALAAQPWGQQPLGHHCAWLRLLSQPSLAVAEEDLVRGPHVGRCWRCQPPPPLLPELTLPVFCHRPSPGCAT